MSIFNAENRSTNVGSSEPSSYVRRNAQRGSEKISKWPETVIVGLNCFSTCALAHPSQSNHCGWLLYDKRVMTMKHELSVMKIATINKSCTSCSESSLGGAASHTPALYPGPPILLNAVREKSSLKAIFCRDMDIRQGIVELQELLSSSEADDSMQRGQRYDSSVFAASFEIPMQSP